MKNGKKYAALLLALISLFLAAGCLTKPIFRRMNSTIRTGRSNGLVSRMLPVTTTAICA